MANESEWCSDVDCLYVGFNEKIEVPYEAKLDCLFLAWFVGGCR